MKKKEISNEKLMFEIAQENKKLSEPLTRALKEVEKLRHELANYQKDKMSLQNAKSRLHVLETQVNDAAPDAHSQQLHLLDSQTCPVRRPFRPPTSYGTISPARFCFCSRPPPPLVRVRLAAARPDVGARGARAALPPRREGARRARL